MGLGTKVTLTPRSTSPFTKASVANAQDRIEELLAGHNSLNDDVLAEINSLKDSLAVLSTITDKIAADAAKDDTVITLNDSLGFKAGDVIIILDEEYTIDSISGNDLTLTSGLVEDVPADTTVSREKSINVNEVLVQIETLANIFSQSGTANDVFDALVLLGESWNAGGDLSVAIEGTFDSDTGELIVDLSNFGFSSVDDYKFMGSVDDKGALLTSTGFTKVNENTAKVVAYDRACFVEDAVPFDASSNSFKISMLVSYSRPLLSFTITDEDGNEFKVE